MLNYQRVQYVTVLTCQLLMPNPANPPWHLELWYLDIKIVVYVVSCCFPQLSTKAWLSHRRGPVDFNCEPEPLSLCFLPKSQSTQQQNQQRSHEIAAVLSRPPWLAPAAQPLCFSVTRELHERCFSSTASSWPYWAGSGGLGHRLCLHC